MAGDCVNGFGSCRGSLEPGVYRSAEFQPSFSYTVAPRPAGGPAAWRMMYLSESIQGEPIAVTGTALVPSIAAPDGGRPILSVAHGTTGIADECAPSHDPSSDVAAHIRYVNAGYLVAISDYEGLGTPGRHPYLVGESEGRSVLDAAKRPANSPAPTPATSWRSGAIPRAGTPRCGRRNWRAGGRPSWSSSAPSPLASPPT